MKKYGGLLQRIASELRINKGTAEPEEKWKSRIIYSAIGQLAYASLWDKPEEGDVVSITHFKRRIEKMAVNYGQLYPEIALHLDLNPDILADMIYKVYLNNGYLYHQNYYISPPIMRVSALNDHIHLVRGTPLGKPVFSSGLGMYQKVLDNDNIPSKDIREMFGLTIGKVEDAWNFCIANAAWKEMSIPESAEYLKMHPPFRSGYWTHKAVADGAISIMRIMREGISLYYLYRMENGRLYVQQLPEWYGGNGAYRILSNGCLAVHAQLPPAIFRMDGEIVHVSLQYLYPPKELDFFCLYSWPENGMALPSQFNRIFDKEIFIGIKQIFEQIGYQFKEEF